MFDKCVEEIIRVVLRWEFTKETGRVLCRSNKFLASFNLFLIIHPGISLKFLGKCNGAFSVVLDGLEEHVALRLCSLK